MGIEPMYQSATSASFRFYFPNCYGTLKILKDRSFTLPYLIPNLSIFKCSGSPNISLSVVKCFRSRH